MDIGVVCAWKKWYQKRMLGGIVININIRSERHRLNRQIRSCIRDIQEGYDQHIREATKMANAAWNDVV